MSFLPYLFHQVKETRDGSLVKIWEHSAVVGFHWPTQNWSLMMQGKSVLHIFRNFFEFILYIYVILIIYMESEQSCTISKVPVTFSSSSSLVSSIIRGSSFGQETRSFHVSSSTISIHLIALFSKVFLSYYKWVELFIYTFKNITYLFNYGRCFKGRCPHFQLYLDVIFLNV